LHSSGCHEQTHFHGNPTICKIKLKTPITYQELFQFDRYKYQLKTKPCSNAYNEERRKVGKRPRKCDHGFEIEKSIVGETEGAKLNCFKAPKV